MNHVRCYQEGYPRPQLVRAGWHSLNGEWEFSFDPQAEGDSQGWQNGFCASRTIRVPFAVQTKASGVGEETLCRSVWYRRTLAWRIHAGKRVLLHFEGVDYRCTVWVNGSPAGTHTGAYTRFSLEITDFLRDGDNRITVNARDSYELTQPRGKQRWKESSFTCHYTDTTGIWKTVWLEEVPLGYIRSVRYVTCGQTVQCLVETDGAAAGSEVQVRVAGEGMFTAPVNENGQAVLTIAPERPRLWMPGAPQLYDAELSFGEDTVGSYFGIAEYATRDGKLLCNGREVFPKMLLLQGYWKDSGMTCPSDAVLLADLEAIGAAGANGVRMHQKTESEPFYYYADVLGLLVWAEMPSAFVFSPAAMMSFFGEYAALIAQFASHPGIQALVVFNESWGMDNIMNDRMQQHFADSLYFLTKALCPDKLCIGNDGWEHCMTDVITFHEYAQDPVALEAVCRARMQALKAGVPVGQGRETLVNAKYYTGQPVMVSEYGGVTFFPQQEGWGYGKGAKTAKELYDRLFALTQAVRKTGCAGYCLTQATDCEQERNGIMDHERNLKLSLKELRNIFAL